MCLSLSTAFPVTHPLCVRILRLLPATASCTWKRKDKTLRRTFPDFTEKSHLIPNYFGLIHEIRHSLFLLHLPWQFFKFMPAEIHTSKLFTGRFGLKELHQLLCCVFTQMLFERYPEQHLGVTLAAGTWVYKNPLLLLAAHKSASSAPSLQSHQHWKSEDLFGLLNPISGAWQIFSACLMHQETDESFVPVLLWREKTSTLTSNSGISLSKQKWQKIN